MRYGAWRPWAAVLPKRSASTRYHLYDVKRGHAKLSGTRLAAIIRAVQFAVEGVRIVSFIVSFAESMSTGGTVTIVRAKEARRAVT